MFIPVNFPSNFIMDKYGAKTGILIGCVLTILAMWIKIFINSGFYIVLIGQTLAAIAQPFILNAPAKVSAAWYSEEGRAMATTIASAANPLGVAIGFVFPSFFVPDDVTEIEQSIT